MKYNNFVKTFLFSSILLLIITPVVSQTLNKQGPSPFVGGQSEASNANQVGAINAIAAHPVNADILYIGTVNGGVWKTLNATNANPNWTPLTDDQASNSILDLAFDPTDATHQTLVAGIGRTSSLRGIGGPRTGLLITTDGGDNWTPLNGGLAGKNISGVVPRGSTIVASVDIADDFFCDNIGIMRSTNSGNTFIQVTNGIFGGGVDALTGDPTNNAVLYASIIFGATCGGSNGIYKSSDTGTSWVKVSNATMDAELIDSTATHVEIAVGQSNNVYVAIANNGQLAGVYRSGNGGASFTTMDLPGTIEVDIPTPIFVGLHPGGQADIHMSIVADPNNANLVYIGGDRQPGAFSDGDNGSPLFPNSINAMTFSGRMFRGDASLALGSQWLALTHVGTANNTSAHADSRDMMFDANGNLLESDDGGIYKRTLPQNATGDWFSINGNLQNTEVHSAAYDSNADILGGGTQDNSQGFQLSTADPSWEVLLGGDGGDYIVDTQTLAGTNQSIRYTSSQNLGNFVRIIYNQNNSLSSFVFPALTVVGGGDLNPRPQFVTPTAINSQNGNRLIIGYSNRDLDNDINTPNGGVYESLDQGDTITQLMPKGIEASDPGVSSIVAGGPGNEELLYVAADTDLYRRINAGEALVSVFNSTNEIIAVNQDNEDVTQAFFIEQNGSVYRTETTGSSWTDIGGNLSTLNPGRLWSVLHLNNALAAGADMVAVGADSGLFVSSESTGFTTWTKLNVVPNVPVFGLSFDSTINELFVNTLGRGTFSYGPVFGAASILIFKDGFE